LGCFTYGESIVELFSGTEQPDLSFVWRLLGVQRPLSTSTPIRTA
jgi:hypothetical protein